MHTRNRPVVLLVAEAVTLAHFARIVTLAKALDASSYEVVVASDPRYSGLEGPLAFRFHPVRSIPSGEFERALARGKPLYDAETLAAYVEEDLALIRDVKPNLIVGDFRLSLAISAPVAGVPYAAVVNAYWSPYARIRYPVPDLPMSRLLGVGVAQRLFDLVRPAAFRLHSRPLNQVRRRYNLAPLGRDLRTSYTWGDYTLYADAPELVPMGPLPSNHRYLGAPLWSARTSLPDWWDRIPTDRPPVLVSLGSSGRSDLLPTILAALSDLPNPVLVATAGRIDLKDIPPNARVAAYLPLASALQRSALIICNGGSLTTYQAMDAGAPVLGICSNMDQLLNMSAIERMGAGRLLRAACVSATGLREAVHALLNNASYRQAAKAAGARFRRSDARRSFRAFVSEVLDSPTSAKGDGACAQ